MENEKPKMLERYTESQGLRTAQMHLQAFGINSVTFIFYLPGASKCNLILTLQLLSLLGFVHSMREQAVLVTASSVLTETPVNTSSKHQQCLNLIYFQGISLVNQSQNYTREIPTAELLLYSLSLYELSLVILEDLLLLVFSIPSVFPTASSSKGFPEL